MLRNKKGQMVLPLTIGLILFNVFWYILIVAFTSDGVVIGEPNNFYETELNATGDDIDTDTTAVYDQSWIARFFINVWNLPWWLNIFVVLLNGVGLVIILAAWFRGV